jgi:hypothetical protein
MNATSCHPALKQRLTDLERRIGELKVKIAAARGVQKIEDVGDIEDLEQRHKELAAQLDNLDREGRGWAQNVKAELDLMADDLTASIERCMTRADDGSLEAVRPGQKPRP